MNNPGDIWSDEEEKILRSMEKEGKTFGEIAEALRPRKNGGILMHVREMSALNTGIRNNKDNLARPKTDSFPDNNRKWTKEDERQLLVAFTLSGSFDQIAKKFGRSTHGVVSHIDLVCKEHRGTTYSELFNKIRKYLRCSKKI